MDTEWAGVIGSDQSTRDDVSTTAGWAVPDLSPEEVKVNAFRSEVRGWVVDQVILFGTPQTYLTQAWRADLVFMASFPLCAYTYYPTKMTTQTSRSVCGRRVGETI